MKKMLVILMVVMALAMVVVPATQAMSGACEGLSGTVTNSSSQAWHYAQCVGDSLSKAWDLFWDWAF